MKRKIEESKHDKFVRLAESRTNKIIEAFRILGNLSNTITYEYSQDEVDYIFQEIERELAETKKKFVKQEPEKPVGFSFSRSKK